MAKDKTREEEIKNKIARDYFTDFDCTKILGDVDFCVTLKPKNTNQLELETESFLWAEAKKGKADFITSVVQLILTIGKARTFDSHLPPAYLGSFDAEKIAFIPYNEIHDVFYINDFNWNVTPSNYETKEFKQLYDKVFELIEKQTLVFFFGKDDKDINDFIKTNFILGKSSTSKVRIDKNNFIVIYTKWLTSVKPTIAVKWDVAKKIGIIDGDFYLADLLSNENETLKQNLSVILKKNHYELERIADDMGMFQSKTTVFMDKQAAHHQFWNKYERPPKKEYWDYIIERRDLLVPQDVRERKGSFFTPQIWVELSQKYLTDTLGEDWQDEYYIWDCAAGTGNLLTGLTNKFNVFASTLDKQDVDVMHSRIETMNENSVSGQGSNLLESHVFQFDFLNDSFDKLPKLLLEIINDSEKRKKLVIYINPPYAEASNKRTLVRGTEGNRGVEQNTINKKYAKLLGQGNAELFAQFLTRIFFEINGCVIGEFSKVKILNGQHFIDFRNFFTAKLEKCFVVPASTFDNVKGTFPIGFMIWNTSIKEKFKRIKSDVFDKDGNFLGKKKYFAYDDSQYINDWIKPFRADPKQNQLIGKFPFKGNDFQNQNMIQIVHHKMDYNVQAGQFLINQSNVKEAGVYFAVRKTIKADWLNDRDQFLFPNKKWKKDVEFQNDCLAFTLFSNNIRSEYGTNNWIPFTEYEVNAMAKFESDFMARYIAGKVNTEITTDLFSTLKKEKQKKIEFSTTAKAVFDAGRELWKYYHTTINTTQFFLGQKPNVNASLYDIREYFQGRNTNGKMNSKSDDKEYMKLIGNLRTSLKILAKKIEPKIYEYGFLKE
jgi:hypothetical protein